jgi:hypothetical protein
MHSFGTLADDIAILLAANSMSSKNTGDTGGTGDRSCKLLRSDGNAVSGQEEELSPVPCDRGQALAPTGDGKAQYLSDVLANVPAVPGATGNLLGVHPVALACRFEVMGYPPAVRWPQVTAMTDQTALIWRSSDASRTSGLLKASPSVFFTVAGQPGASGCQSLVRV